MPHPRGVAVAYEVDATDLANTHPPLHPPFDRIIWNFPCVPVEENGGGCDGDDGHGGDGGGGDDGGAGGGGGGGDGADVGDGEW